MSSDSEKKRLMLGIGAVVVLAVVVVAYYGLRSSNRSGPPVPTRTQVKSDVEEDDLGQAEETAQRRAPGADTGTAPARLEGDRGEVAQSDTASGDGDGQEQKVRSRGRRRPARPQPKEEEEQTEEAGGRSKPKKPTVKGF